MIVSVRKKLIIEMLQEIKYSAASGEHECLGLN